MAGSLRALPARRQRTRSTTTGPSGDPAIGKVLPSVPVDAGTAAAAPIVIMLSESGRRSHGRSEVPPPRKRSPACSSLRNSASPSPQRRERCYQAAPLLATRDSSESARSPSRATPTRRRPPSARRRLAGQSRSTPARYSAPPGRGTAFLTRRGTPGLLRVSC